jgi:ribonuclease Z
MRSVFYPHLVNDPFGDPALYVRLAHRGEAILFDCGDLHPLTPREILKVRSVFISHAHIDHLVGFDTLLRFFLYRERPLVLYGPPGFIERIAHRLAGYTWNLIEDYPLVLVVREWGSPQGREAVFRACEAFARAADSDFDCPEGLLLETADFTVRAVPLDHGGIVSLAFCLEETLHVAIHRDALEARGYQPGPWLTQFKALVRRGAPPHTPVAVRRAHGDELYPLGELAETIAHTERGMKVVYVTDASPSQENQEKIVELATEAHLLVIEATFSQSDEQRARRRNHLTAHLAGSLGRRARVSRILVFHHSPRYEHEPQRLAREAFDAFTSPEETTA